MKKIFYYFIFAAFINLCICTSSTYANFGNIVPSYVTNQMEQESDVSYYELDMFKSIAEYGELTEAELRAVVKTLKQCGLVNNDWHIKNKGGAEPIRCDNKYSSTYYEYKRTNKDLGYRRLGISPETGKLVNFLDDIVIEAYIRVSAGTKKVEKITLTMYSYFGGMFFPHYTYPAAKKYSRELVVYENGKCYASLNDLKLDKEYAKNALLCAIDDLDAQYNPDYKFLGAEYNPIFNGNSEIFTEIYVHGKLTKQVYGYPEGKEVKSFEHIYIFNNVGTLVDCVRKTEDLK